MKGGERKLATETEERRERNVEKKREEKRERKRKETMKEKRKNKSKCVTFSAVSSRPPLMHFLFVITTRYAYNCCLSYVSLPGARHTCSLSISSVIHFAEYAVYDVRV